MNLTQTKEQLEKENIKIIERIDFDGKIKEIEISGFTLKPMWKRWILAICFWKYPSIIIKNPKIITEDKREVLFG